MSAHNIPMTAGKITTASTVDLSRVVVRRPQLTFDAIKWAVAEAYGVTVAQIDSRRRIGCVAWARQVAMHLCRILLNASTAEVGLEFGRDHGTVSCASTHIRNLMDTDARVRDQIQRLQAQVRGL